MKTQTMAKGLVLFHTADSRKGSSTFSKLVRVYLRPGLKHILKDKL